MFRGNRTTESVFSNSQVKSSYLSWISVTQVKIVRVSFDLPWRFIPRIPHIPHIILTHELLVIYSKYSNRVEGVFLHNGIIMRKVYIIILLKWCHVLTSADRIDFLLIKINWVSVERHAQNRNHYHHVCLDCNVNIGNVHTHVPIYHLIKCLW